MSTQEGGWGIRTSDLRFMRRGPQPIELSLGDVKYNNLAIWEANLSFSLKHTVRDESLNNFLVNVLT
jgi:hypothetical protein